jgi:hypothetical protein
MSSDMFSSMKVLDETKPVEYQCHCSLKFNKKDYCSYEGVCENHRVINQNLTCIMCMYRRPLDVPEMIRKELEK